MSRTGIFGCRKALSFTSGFKLSPQLNPGQKAPDPQRIWSESCLSDFSSLLKRLQAGDLEQKNVALLSDIKAVFLLADELE